MEENKLDSEETKKARLEETETCACPTHEGGLVMPSHIITQEGEYKGWCNTCQLKAIGEGSE